MWVAMKKNLPTIEEYPYISRHASCNHEYVNSLVNVKVKRFVRVPKSDAGLMEAAVDGVLSVGIYAGTSLFSYDEGIYYDPSTCQSTSFPNHAVNLVGYGVEGGRKYWTVRNSWGSQWGEEGYFRMSRDYDNTCKIHETAFRVDFKCVEDEECVPEANMMK